MILSLLILLLLILLYEVIRPKGRSVKASSQAWSYYNPSSQAVLRYMLSNWARTQRSTVGQCEKHEDNVESHQ